MKLFGNFNDEDDPDDNLDWIKMFLLSAFLSWPLGYVFKHVFWGVLEVPKEYPIGYLVAFWFWWKILNWNHYWRN